MKHVLLSMATVILGLAVAGGVQAGSKGSGHSSGSRGSGSHTPNSSVSFHGSGSRNYANSYNGSSGSYHSTHAKNFAHGYYYPGRSHNHWSYFCWDNRYGCRVYYDPGLFSYFYFCVPDNCYYPVTYCPYQRYSFEAAAPAPALAAAPAPVPPPANAPPPVLTVETATAVASASAAVEGEPTAPPRSFPWGMVK